jgi:hypothetical protein
MMAECIVVKTEDGKLAGLGEKGGRQFARFQAAVREMEVGETMRFSFKIPRSPGFHKRHFVIINRVFEQQEQFEDDEKFREWIQVGAGFCDLLPGPNGKPVAISRSIAWEALEDAEFAEHHAAVIAFLRSARCTRFLWPEWSDLDADTFINNVLAEFGA